MNISLSNWWSWGILLLLLMIVAVVDSRKRIPRKISIFILVPVLSVVIIFMMSENNKEAEQSFHTLEEAVTAYDDRSDVVATLRGKTSALVIMDDGDVMDSQIFEKTESGWKLPEDSEFQDTKRFTGDRIIVDVSTVAVDGVCCGVTISGNKISHNECIRFGRNRIFRSKRKRKRLLWISEKIPRGLLGFCKWTEDGSNRVFEGLGQNWMENNK